VNDNPRRNRRWIWFFLTLAVVAVAALVVLNRFLWSQQLTLAQLQEAEELWARNGPHDYDMKYIQTDSTLATYYVSVRQSKVVKVTRNGEPLQPRQYDYHGMPALFGFIKDFLVQEAQPGKPRAVMRATFDPQDGHVIRFFRRVAGSGQVEINVSYLTPVTPASP
jgi:hypothetical protein